MLMTINNYFESITIITQQAMVVTF